MRNELPAIVVTLPARSVSEAASQIQVARKAGADLVEVRLDRWSNAERSQVHSLFPSPIPLLATLRSHAEGGEGPDDPEERAGILAVLARLPFSWLDFEVARDPVPKRQKSPTGSEGGTPSLLASSHLVGANAFVELSRILTERLAGADVVKVVLPATLNQLHDEVLPAISQNRQSAIVVHTTGPSGPLLRALSRKFGFGFVFACLPRGGQKSGDSSPVEPSQIPVDRLRFYFSQAVIGPLFAVLGQPVAHSLSPYLHSRWMREMDHRGLYVPLEATSEEEFAASVPRLAEEGFLGLSITHPFKESALAVATQTGRGAEECGCANTLTMREGRISAENTDLLAVQRRLSELRNTHAWEGDGLTVVGSGGAARATLGAAVALHIPSRILARRRPVGESLARRFGATLEDPHAPRIASLLVHATPAGRLEASLPTVPLIPLLGQGSHVLDFVYAPEDPFLRVGAENQGATYEDGWRLLVYQAAASYGIWWKREPSAESVDRLVTEGPCTA